MSALVARELRWTWADGTVALDGVDLTVAPGERVLVTGPSGCGKSTLVRLASGLLQRHGDGRIGGSVAVSGEDPARWDGPARARAVGVVFQDPQDQIVTGRVGDEVAFGAVSAGRSADPGWLGRVGLTVRPERSPHALSGGQQQRLAVAGALAGGAGLLLLDEPLAHLDRAGSEALLAQLDGLARAGTAIVLVEHRLEAALAWCDRVVVLDRGRVAHDGAAPDPERLRGDGLEVPPTARIAAAGGLDALGPVTVPDRPSRPACVHLAAERLAHGTHVVLEAVDVDVRAGEVLAVVGANGSGKSTLLAALERAAPDRCVRVPQDPDLSLFCSTVADELAYGPDERGVAPAVRVADMGLGGLERRAPLGLSRGQRQRVAVGAAASVGPEVLLLDEPTAGQHADAVRATLAAVRRARPDGALVLATHDVELALAVADRAIALGAGRVLDEGPPERVLRALVLPPLQEAQRARGWPLADVDRQLASSGRGPADLPREPALLDGLPEREEGPEPARAASYGAVAAVLGVSGLAVLLDRPASLGILAGVSLLALLTRPIGAVARRRVLLGVLAVVWSTVLSQGLFYGDLPRTALIELGPLVIWREGVGWGLVQSLRLVAVGAAGLSVALTSAPDRLLDVLRGLRVPGGPAFLALTALRFVPVVAGEWGTVREARARRGRPLHRRGPWAWLTTELTMLRPLVARALRRAGRLGEALESRGFEPGRDRGPVPGWTAGDRVLAGLSGGAVAVVLVLQIVHGLYLLEVWRHPSLNPLYAWVRAWL